MRFNKNIGGVQVEDEQLTVEEMKERKIMKLLLKVKNGTPPQRKSALRQLTDKAREFGAGPLFNQILPLLMSPTLEDQERHLLVKVSTLPSQPLSWSATTVALSAVPCLPCCINWCLGDLLPRRGMSQRCESVMVYGAQNMVKRRRVSEPVLWLQLQVIDRILYKLDELVRPFVHKILVVIEPLLIDEDYYARVEGREIIANLSKAAGLATMIAAMRPDIDNIDEYAPPQRSFPQTEVFPKLKYPCIFLSCAKRLFVLLACVIMPSFTALMKHIKCLWVCMLRVSLSA